MKALRRNTDRLHIQQVTQDIWLSFYPDERAESIPQKLGDLAAFIEMRLPPSTISALNPDRRSQVITYAYRGSIAQEDTAGNAGLIHAGEFQRAFIDPKTRYREINPSHSSDAHIFRISLHLSEAEPESAQEQRRFPVALRHNLLCVIASPDGRKKSLRINQDAFIYSSVLDPGHHLVHELLPGRSTWLHVIRGEAVMQEVVLTSGDGVGVTSEPSVSITAQEDTEILLVDLGLAMGRP
jgi:redox-sensitive bicupin YhaK (pirin superfamily)